MTNPTTDIETSPHATFTAFLEKGELAYQVRPNGTPVFFPRVVAPGTGETDLEWRVSSGLGVVYSTTVVHRRDEAPLNVCLVEMEEGFRLMSRVVGVPAAQVHIGMTVKLHVAVEGAQTLPLFTPANKNSKEVAE